MNRIGQAVLSSTPGVLPRVRPLALWFASEDCTGRCSVVAEAGVAINEGFDVRLPVSVDDAEVLLVAPTDSYCSGCDESGPVIPDPDPETTEVVKEEEYSYAIAWWLAGGDQ